MLNTLLVAALGTGLVGGVYAWVGVRLARRRVENPADRRALRGFALWWLAMAANQGLWTLVNGAASQGLAGVDAEVTYAILQRALLALALAGLMSYLVYIRWGREMGFGIALFYAGYFCAVLYSFHWGTPIGLHSGAWRIDVAFARTPPPGVEALFGLWLLGPPVVGAIVYGLAGRRARDRAQRARVAATSWGLLAWWVLSVASGMPATLDVGWLQALDRVVGLVVALAILLAYDPPAWTTRRAGAEAPRASR